MQEPGPERPPPPSALKNVGEKQRRKLSTFFVKGLALCLGLLLIAWMLYRTGWVREMVVSRLAVIGRPGVPLLRGALHDEDHKVREAARNALLGLGPERAVPSLIESLRDTDPAVRAQACAALELFGKDATAAAPVLVALLRDPNPEVRMEAARAIAAVGAGAQDAVPDLLALTQDASPAMRVEALEALGRVGWRQSDRALPVLIKCLADSNATVRAEAAEALGHFARQGVNVEAAKTALRLATQDPDTRVRREAAEALSNAARTARKPLHKD